MHAEQQEGRLVMDEDEGPQVKAHSRCSNVRKGSKAFTAVEILVLIVIIGGLILAFLFMGRVLNPVTKKLIGTLPSTNGVVVALPNVSSLTIGTTARGTKIEAAVVDAFTCNSFEYHPKTIFGPLTKTITAKDKSAFLFVGVVTRKLQTNSIPLPGFEDIILQGPEGQQKGAAPTPGPLFYVIEARPGGKALSVCGDSYGFSFDGLNLQGGGEAVYKGQSNDRKGYVVFQLSKSANIEQHSIGIRVSSEGATNFWRPHLRDQ